MSLRSAKLSQHGFLGEEKKGCRGLNLVDGGGGREKRMADLSSSRGKDGRKGNGMEEEGGGALSLSLTGIQMGKIGEEEEKVISSSSLFRQDLSIFATPSIRAGRPRGEEGWQKKGVRFHGAWFFHISSFLLPSPHWSYKRIRTLNHCWQETAQSVLDDSM